MRRFIISTVLLCGLGQMTQVSAQIPFHKGVNLSNWFQVNNARQIQFTTYTKQDFVNIKSLGCDVIRLPINLHYMTNGTPDYIIDPLFFSFLDSAVNWAEDLHIYLLLDNHTFDPKINTDPAVGTILNKIWTQMAQHYKDRSMYILYEVLNEPHGLTTQGWSQIQQTVISTIRSFDTRHTIIVGGSGYNSIYELKNLPDYSDTNLIYTFHFYDPMIFTHQGADWVTPSLVPLAGVPFPFDSARMPACPALLKGSWVESDLTNYDRIGTAESIKKLLDVAIDFKKHRNGKVFCGEFGVYRINSNNTDRVLWYDSVRNYLENNGIPWTIWDYQDGFGLFKKGSNDMFDYDLNTLLLQALGLNVPVQKTYVLRPDSIGFPIYDDYIERQIFGSGYTTNGTEDYYNTSKPNNGRYCIYWTGGVQYDYISFTFKPYKDLSVLETGNYAVDFMVRGDSAGSMFDVFFMDVKTTQPGSHPWRMGITIDETYAKWDRHWHHVHIPFENMIEKGAWDSIWYDPQGKFDWKTIDRIEIAADQHNMKKRHFWFDNIIVTNLDTAVVWDTSAIIVQRIDTTLGIPVISTPGFFDVFPNPMQHHVTFNYQLKEQGIIDISIYNLTGQKVLNLLHSRQTEGFYQIHWNTNEKSKKEIFPGLYLCRFTVDGMTKTIKIIKE